MCTKLQTLNLSYTIQTFGELKNRHIHRSGPRFLELLPPPPVYFPRDLHHQACERPQEADVHNLETIGPQLYRTFTGGRQLLYKIASVYSIHYRHQKHHNSIDITGAMHRRRKPQPQLSPFFARQLLNQTVTKSSSLSRRNVDEYPPQQLVPTKTCGRNSGETKSSRKLLSYSLFRCALSILGPCL